MKLYTFSGAPNPRRVHIYLAEKGIEVPFEPVDLMKRENRTPEFISRVNAMGALPVLELDDGSHIAESVAICRYFEVEHPDPPLFGLTAREQAIVEMWNRRIELNFMMPVGMVWLHGSPLTKSVVKRQIPEMAKQNRSLVRQYFKFLDRHLEQNEFFGRTSGPLVQRGSGPTERQGLIARESTLLECSGLGLVGSIGMPSVEATECRQARAGPAGPGQKGSLDVDRGLSSCIR